MCFCILILYYCLPYALIFIFFTNVYTNPISHWTKEKIVKRMQKPSNLKVHPITSQRYEVLGNGQCESVVDLEKQTCKC